MAILQVLGKLLRVRVDEVESVLRHDERRARDTINRRRFMSAAAALASAPFVPSEWIQLAAPSPEDQCPGIHAAIAIHYVLRSTGNFSYPNWKWFRQVGQQQ